MRSLGVSGVQLSSYIFENGVWLTMTGMNLAVENLAMFQDWAKNSLAQFFENLRNLASATWNSEIRQQIFQSIQRYTESFGEWVVSHEETFSSLIEMFIATNCLAVMGFMGLRALMFGSQKLMSVVSNWVFGTLAVNVTSLLQAAAPLMIALGYILGAYSSLKLIRIMSPLLIFLGKKAVCSVKSVFWTCVKLAQWTFTQEDHFIKDMESIIKKMFEQEEDGGNVTMKLQVLQELKSAIAIQDEIKEDEIKDLKVLVNLKNPSEEKSSVGDEPYDYQLTTVINKLKFPQKLLVEILSQTLSENRLCYESASQTGEDPPPFPPKTSSDFEQEEAIDICVKLMKDPKIQMLAPGVAPEGIKTKKQFRQWLLETHPDKNSEVRENPELYDFVKRVIACGSSEFQDVLFS